MFCLGFILFWTVWISWTWVAISFPIVGKFSTIISSSIFFMPFLFVFFFWDPYYSNVGVFNFVPEVSEVVLILILFSFFPLCLIDFLHSVFYLTYPLFFLSYLLLVPSQSACISIHIIFFSFFVFPLLIWHRTISNCEELHKSGLCREPEPIGGVYIEINYKDWLM